MVKDFAFLTLFLGFNRFKRKQLFIAWSSKPLGSHETRR